MLYNFHSKEAIQTLEGQTVLGLKLKLAVLWWCSCTRDPWILPGSWIINPPDFETLGWIILGWCVSTLGRIQAVDSDNHNGYRDGIHESTISLRFLSIVLRFLKLEVSASVFALQNGTVRRRPGQNRVTWKTPSSRALVPLQEPVAYSLPTFPTRKCPYEAIRVWSYTTLISCRSRSWDKQAVET